MTWGPLELIGRLPGADIGLSITRRVLAIPVRIDGILRGVESLQMLADGAAALPELTRHAEALAGLAKSVESLPELTAHAAALEELTRHAGALAELTIHAAALAELPEHAATLPELSRHAAALPDLAPRVQSVELMVERILVYLDALQPAVNDLTNAASDLNLAVAPISRIAGRMPGSKRSGARSLGNGAV